MLLEKAILQGINNWANSDDETEPTETALFEATRSRLRQQIGRISSPVPHGTVVTLDSDDDSDFSMDSYV